MNIEIDPAEVEILDRPGMNEIHAWASYRGHEFEFCSLGHLNTLFYASARLRNVMDRQALSLAVEQLKQDIAAMSAHQRLEFWRKTHAPGV
ncbi:hypothetical protein [Sagittula sp.]|uniref:hypothetical protein n=1 Tax=Sagittula sp. TaxID=2038081 RepID=UPI0035114E9F